MTAPVRFAAGETPVSSDKLNALIDAWNGNTGGVAAGNAPMSLTAINDPIAYAITAKNSDAGSKVALLYKADGSVLLQVDTNGVKASPDGTQAATQIVTISATQTLTSKTLDGNSNTLQVRRDTLTNRPAAGVAGRLFYATDTGVLYLDDGAAWHVVSLSGNQIAVLGTNVGLTAATWGAGPQITLGAGTWLIWGGLQASNASAGSVSMQARITDGAAVRSSAGGTLPAGSSMPFGLPPAKVTPGSSTTYTLQGYSSGASGSILATSPATGEANATAIAALQIG